jgi:carnosine N-methyltransferase
MLTYYCLHAGVGRLVFELVSRGYRVQGNEFSLYMLLASDFLLNSGMCHPENPMEISPWLLESRNLHSSMDAVRYGRLNYKL